MSIRHYSGEYLVCPAPIHMGLNWCSHQCFYCFANLNRPGRRADYDKLRQFMAKVVNKRPGKDIAAHLALRGHPILSSNDSDPFAASNWQQNEAMMHAMLDAGLRFTFQTRGGKGAFEMLQQHPPTMVYISFTTDQPETGKRAEPGAPSHRQRMELAQHAKNCGHFVIAGINPFYPPWWDDIEGFIQWLAANNIRHVWAGEPHLNYMQVAAMPERTKEAFAQERAYFVAPPGKRKAQVPALQALCSAHDINSFTTTSQHGQFWQPYFDLGYPFWPTLEGWFDHLRTIGTPCAFTFEAFHQWADATAGLEASSFKEYIGGIGRSIRDAGQVQAANNMRQVHEFLWRLDEFPTRLRHDDIYIGTQDGNLACDESGRLVLVYAPGLTNPEQGRFDIDQCEGFVGFE